MSNVFKRFTEVVNKPNRAPYDLSFQNNLTMKFGKLYPVFCKEVLPGDSFKIQPTFNFNFMPLISPVQTRMKATLHFFYVRNRPQWKDFMDWDGMTKEGLTPPYIKLTEQNRDMVNTGEIGDFLGIPTEMFDTAYDYAPYETQSGMLLVHDTEYGWSINPESAGGIFTAFKASQFDSVSVGDEFDDLFDDIDISSSHNHSYSVLLNTDNLRNEPISLEATFSELLTANSSVKLLLFDTSGVCRYVSPTGAMRTDSPIPLKIDFGTIQLEESWFTASVNRRPSILCTIVFKKNPSFLTAKPVVNVGVKSVVARSASDMSLSDLPWVSDANPNGLRLNAFPFRAYEAIYNSFYRDERNNPRMVNGQPEYNKYITTDEGGADTTHYKLFQRNWEPDYLTTAVQSPQQGVAPLVGITSVSAAGTIEITDGNGVTYTAQTKLAEDGDTIQGIRVLSENSPTAVNRALVDLASTGISISDLRNVNALQRWLEINMRRGLRYRDQVKSHYGVDIEFKELQMPEFIGGVNEDVIVNRISQTVETEENPLGSLAGQAGVLGTSKHKISHYCDEKGFIIGIFSIAPVPNYSQNLPKHMIKTSQLDYFTPEFAHIGMQPILNSEVTPLQANLEGKLNDVFGYQRPWYEYLASTDEVHGQFRDSMRRYLINRVYDGTPELGSEFLTIDPETINDVFAVTEDTDKIYGQIWFDVTAKRPIASNVTPRIEP